MKFGDNGLIKAAVVTNVDEIIKLYRIVYGKKYPISYGTNPDLLKTAILDSKTHLVLTAFLIFLHFILCLKRVRSFFMHFSYHVFL